MLEKLRDEWPTIKGAPWSVAMIGMILFAAGFSLATLLSTRQIGALQAERDLLKSSLERQVAAQSQSGPSARPAAVTPQIKRLEMPAPPDASYAPQSVAESFLSLKAGRATPLQVNQLLAPYAGKRIRLIGRLVSAEMRGASAWVQLAPENDGDSIFVTFDSRWASQLSAIAPGSTIQIDTLLGEGEPPALIDGSLI